MNFGDFTTAFYVFMGIGLLAFCIQIVALIDVVKSDFRGQNDKIIWILVVLFFGFFGATIYFAIGRTQKLNNR